MIKQLLRLALCIVILDGTAPTDFYISHASAQTAGTQSYNTEQLDALLAPIALYPDALLAQVLMASTYPLEIVHAARRVKVNPKVKGGAAARAVEISSGTPA